jgi:hypothetical protein
MDSPIEIQIDNIFSFQPRPRRLQEHIDLYTNEVALPLRAEILGFQNDNARLRATVDELHSQVSRLQQANVNKIEELTDARVQIAALTSRVVARDEELRAVQAATAIHVDPGVPAVGELRTAGREVEDEMRALRDLLNAPINDVLSRSCEAGIPQAMHEALKERTSKSMGPHSAQRYAATSLLLNDGALVLACATAKQREEILATLAPSYQTPITTIVRNMYFYLKHHEVAASRRSAVFLCGELPGELALGRAQLTLGGLLNGMVIPHMLATQLRTELVRMVLPSQDAPMVDFMVQRVAELPAPPKTIEEMAALVRRWAGPVAGLAKTLADVHMAGAALSGGRTAHGAMTERWGGTPPVEKKHSQKPPHPEKDKKKDGRRGGRGGEPHPKAAAGADSK